jgi:glycosyltransferase involved in cell wall biosynthesis
VKISIVLGPFHPLPPEGIGAVEKVWYELARSFADAGHSVSLIGKSRGNSSQDSNGVRIVPLRGYTASGRLWRDLVTDFLYALEVYRRIEPSDVVITNSFWTPVILSLGRRRGRIVVHVARFPKGQMWLYRKVDVLQAISSAVADEIARQSPSLTPKIRILPYPVDLKIFRSPDVDRSREGDLTILYAGRIHPEKGLEQLVDAFRLVVGKLPNARLRIVGPVPEESGGGGLRFFQKLKASASGLPVTFEEPIHDQNALADVMRQAHCFCYPSVAERGEAFGLAVLEAMATGLPSVVSDLACFRDLLEPGKEGLVFDHRSQNASPLLAEALVQVLSCAETALRMGSNAAGKAKDYELRRVADRYLEMFASL